MKVRPGGPPGYSGRSPDYRARTIRRAAGVWPAAVFVLLWSASASAQVSPRGWYAGAEFDGGFKTLDFNVSDPWGVPTPATSGRRNQGLNIGAHFGLDQRIGRKVVIGAELSLGALGYHGEVRYGLGSDTVAETNGGLYELALVRAGYAIGRVTPYVAIGVMNAKNTVSISDACDVSPCGQTLAAGTMSTRTVRWIRAFGVEFAIAKRIRSRAWALRFEWLQAESRPVVNTPAVTRTYAPTGWQQTDPVEVRTNLTTGAIRVLVDIRLKR